MGERSIDELLTELGYTENLTVDDKKAVADKKRAAEKKERVKNAVEDGMMQGRGGLGGHTRKLLHDIDKSESSYRAPDVSKPKKTSGGSTR